MQKNKKTTVLATAFNDVKMKITRIKTNLNQNKELGGMHKKIKFRSLKNYAVDAYKHALRKITIFLNYQYFEDRVYSDFFQKLMTISQNAVPFKTKQVKGIT